MNVSCDLCGRIPDVDEDSSEYDLHQMCHLPGRETQWWCSSCAGIEKFGVVQCPDEFLDSSGRCSLCDVDIVDLKNGVYNRFDEFLQ